MDQATQIALFIVACYAALFIVDKTIASRLFRSDLTERERLMRDKIQQMETTISVLSDQLNEKAKVEFEQRLGSQQRDNRIEALTREIQELNRQLMAANDKIRQLTQQLERNQVIDRQPREVVVLAIWPDPPAGEPELDTAGEAQALYNSGFEYHIIKGRAANVDGVVREMDRVNPNTLEIGAHDDGTGNIVLSNGATEAGWWGELIQGRQLDLVMLMACRGNIQDSLNVSDILLRAGAKAVVSFDEAVEDAEAVKFAKMVYEKLAENRNITDAVNRAKLVVKRSTREIIRLRLRSDAVM